MDNEKLMKLILATSSNLVEYYKIIERQERLSKMISPAMIMNPSIQQIVKNYENISKLNRSFQLPLSTSDTIQKLMIQSSEIANRYSKYYDQLNRFVKILNPSLSSFISQNSKGSFTNFDSIKDFDLLYINSFDSVKDDYDESVQVELDTLKDNFETKSEFQSEVADLLNNGTREITTDIYLAFAQIIEKYVGVINSRAIALFLSFIILTYTVLMPMYKNQLSSETEERLYIKIEKIEETDKHIIDKLDSIDYKVDKIEENVKKAVDDKFEKSNDKIEEIKTKIDLLNEKVDKLNNEKTN